MQDFNPFPTNHLDDLLASFELPLDWNESLSLEAYLAQVKEGEE